MDEFARLFLAYDVIACKSEHVMRIELAGGAFRHSCPGAMLGEPELLSR
jgi:hypothetical protein